MLGTSSLVCVQASPLQGSWGWGLRWGGGAVSGALDTFHGRAVWGKANTLPLLVLPLAAEARIPYQWVADPDPRLSHQ